MAIVMKKYLVGLEAWKDCLNTNHIPRVSSKRVVLIFSVDIVRVVAGFPFDLQISYKAVGKGINLRAWHSVRGFTCDDRRDVLSVT